MLCHVNLHHRWTTDMSNHRFLDLGLSPRLNFESLQVHLVNHPKGQVLHDMANHYHHYHHPKGQVLHDMMANHYHHYHHSKVQVLPTVSSNEKFHLPLQHHIHAYRKYDVLTHMVLRRYANNSCICKTFSVIKRLSKIKMITEIEE